MSLNPLKISFMKKALLSLFIACCIGPIGPLMAFDDFDDFDIDEFLDDGLFEIQAPVAVQDDCFPTQSILDLLTPPTNPGDNLPMVNVIKLLREDIYKKTTGPITRRSLLDMPALTPDFFYNDYWTLTGDLFFNYTPKVFLTKNSAFISSYIDLKNESIINELDNSDIIDVDVPDVLGLFSTIKLQQYRAGIMFGFARHWDCFTLTGRIPLYYLLENFFLTDEERCRIKKHPLIRDNKTSKPMSAEEEVKFGLKHLVCDKFGVGDSRMTFLLRPIHEENKGLWFGLQLTIPTAKSFDQGLIARDFNPDAPIPPFNLQHYFNVFFCNDNQKLADATIQRELTDFLLDTVDRLSTILVNAPLGNGKHWGLGPEVDVKYCVNDYFSMRSYASIQAYTPHRENRFYLIEKQDSDFDRDWRDPALASENLPVLNRLIVQTLFPIKMRATIHPGIRFQFNHAFLYKSEHWDCSLGFDYWYFGEELQQVRPEIPYHLPLQLKKGCRPAAHQGKLFASFGYYDSIDRSRCDTDWYVAAHTGLSVFNEGIGRNYTISIRFGFEF